MRLVLRFGDCSEAGNINRFTNSYTAAPEVSAAFVLGFGSGTLRGRERWAAAAVTRAAAVYCALLTPGKTLSTFLYLSLARALDLFLSRNRSLLSCSRPHCNLAVDSSVSFSKVRPFRSRSCVQAVDCYARSAKSSYPRACPAYSHGETHAARRS